jgi:hypothetical protein
MDTSLSDMLRDAGASQIFWLGLAIVLVISIVGYLVTRRSRLGPSSTGESGRVLQDWTPTGRIDFAGPSMDASVADKPALFYLQAEDIRRLVSLSGIERKEIRWRKATLNEAKIVVNIFHRYFAKETESASPATASSGEVATPDVGDVGRQP